MKRSVIGKLMLAGLLAWLPWVAWAADVASEEVTYTVDGDEHVGYMAYPADAAEPRPGVLVVHEWWGMNEHARNSADHLAEAGYVALALDMYGAGSVADHPDEAGAMAGKVRENLDTMRARFQAAADLLREHDSTDAERIAAIGYCFGGGVVLQMAREGLDLAGVASFHGSLGTDDPAEPGEIEADILVLHGAADQLVGEEQVEAFHDEMEAANADYELVSYEGAQHSFTNPEADAVAEEFGLPVGYDEAADRKSWQKLEEFLAEVFAE